MVPLEILHAGSHRYPVVASIPHSGVWIPHEVRARFSGNPPLSGTDWHLPQLYSFLKDRQVTQILANFSRFAADVDCPPQPGADGFPGGVPQRTGFGRPLYPAPLSKAEMRRRLSTYHTPYHTALHRLIADKLQHFPRVYLLDLHSFPLLNSGCPPGSVLLGSPGYAVSLSTLDILSGCFYAEGYRPAPVPLPGSGGFVCQNARRAFQNRVECVRISIDYTTYIGNRNFGEEHNPGYDTGLFGGAQQRFSRVFEKACREFIRAAARKYP